MTRTRHIAGPSTTLLNWAPTRAGSPSVGTARVEISPQWLAQRARDDGAPPPVLQLLLYPITNYADRTRSQGLFADGLFLRRWDMDFCDDKYVAGSGVDPADPRVSPLLAEDLSGLPPAIVITAGFDPLRDEGRQYAEALSAAGNVVDEREYGSLIHAFANFSTLGGGSATAIADITSALRAHLSRG